MSRLWAVIEDIAADIASDLIGGVAAIILGAICAGIIIMMLWL